MTTEEYLEENDLHCPTCTCDFNADKEIEDIVLNQNEQIDKLRKLMELDL